MPVYMCMYVCVKKCTEDYKKKRPEYYTLDL